MPAIPWLLLSLLFLAVLLSRRLFPSPSRAAREQQLARSLAEMSVSLPKLPLPKPAEKVYHKATE